MPARKLTLATAGIPQKTMHVCGLYRGYSSSPRQLFFPLPQNHHAEFVKMDQMCYFLSFFCGVPVAHCMVPSEEQAAFNI